MLVYFLDSRHKDSSSRSFGPDDQGWGVVSLRDPGLEASVYFLDSRQKDGGSRSFGPDDQDLHQQLSIPDSGIYKQS